MSYPLPRWIAHRGGGALAPENTLAGIRLAARLGFKAVEFDVMLTADGVPILIHDETLERTTDGRGGVAATPWSIIQGLDAGKAFHPAWTGERVPTLEAALDLCETQGLAVNLEIKPAAGLARETALAVARVIANRQPAVPLLLSSFSETALAVAYEHLPDIPRAWLVESLPPGWQISVDTLGCSALHVSAQQVEALPWSEIAEARLAVAAYTVNDPAMARCCGRRGVQALFTDRLDGFGSEETFADNL